MRVARVFLAVGLIGCGAADAGEARYVPRSPVLNVVLLDRSASRTKQQVDAERELLRGIADSLGFGDRFVLQRVHWNGRNDDIRPWREDLPQAPPGRKPQPAALKKLQQRRAAIGATLAEMQTGQPAPWTDLFATLHDVADHLGEWDHRGARIIILSDMLHSRPDLDMDGSGSVPSPEWVEKQKSIGALPDLKGACVSVVGANPSTPKGRALRSFWQAYFDAAGASMRLEDYRLLAMDPSRIPCRPPLSN